MTSQQILAIVSAAAPSVTSATVNLDNAADYEFAIAALEALDVRVDRHVHQVADSFVEVATAETPELFRYISLVAPTGYVSPAPEDRVVPSPEGRLALRVIPGGVPA